MTSTYTISLFFCLIYYRDNTIYLGIAWKEIINEIIDVMFECLIACAFQNYFSDLMKVQEMRELL